MFGYFQKGEPKINHIKNISYNSNHTPSNKILVSRDKKINQNVYYTRKQLPLEKGNMVQNRLQYNNAHHHHHNPSESNSQNKQIQGKKNAAKGFNNFKNTSNLLFRRRNYSSYLLGKDPNFNSLGYPGPESKKLFNINFRFIRKDKCV